MTPDPETRIDITNLLGYEILAGGEFIALRISAGNGQPVAVTFPYAAVSDIFNAFRSAVTAARLALGDELPEPAMLAPLLADTVKAGSLPGGSHVVVGLASKDFRSDWAMAPDLARQFHQALGSAIEDAARDGKETRQ